MARDATRHMVVTAEGVHRSVCIDHLTGNYALA